MKKIITFLAITAMLFACSKEEILIESDQELAIENRGGLTVTTDEATYILPFGATSGGTISKGSSKHLTERGVCFSTSENPTIDDEKVSSGSGTGHFTSLLPGLLDNETYYARAYANKSKKGSITTIYGNEISFTTPEAIYDIAVDNNGNTFNTIEIGTKVWMLENLNSTKYRDGTDIDNVTDAVEWAETTDGAYCNYDNNAANTATYGRLYNGYAVEDSRNIAPDGWHVATKDEVIALLDYVGGNEKWGGKLKEAGFEHWNSPNMGADNSSAYTALPGGFRMEYGSTETFQFNYLRYQGRWWATGPAGDVSLHNFYMGYNFDNVMGIKYDAYPPWQYKPMDRNNGYSVRCVKDIP